MKLTKAALLPAVACASAGLATAATAQDRPASALKEADQEVSLGGGFRTGPHDQVGRTYKAGFRFRF